MKKINIKGHTIKELEEFALSIGEKKFRGKQLFDWLYTREVSSFKEMNSISKSLRDKLDDIATIGSINIIKVQESKDGTKKFLFELEDSKRIESVLIPPKNAFISPEAEQEEEQKRLTLCISTQVGCPLDCIFCATSAMGYQRNLTAGEIIDQILQVKKNTNQKITNLVYMGMGEPLLNYENVMKSIEIITTGMNIAARRITVSTSGWIPKIQQMADENRKVKLAISLHSLDDAVRSRLMPAVTKFSVKELLNAVEYYYQKMKRRPTFEYILFNRINDRDEDVKLLVKLSKRIPCKINIIPFHSNIFIESNSLPIRLHPSVPERVEEFVERLRSSHLTVFVRSSAGEDIDAACGQLAVRNPMKRHMSTSPILHHSILEIL